jgi:hypothetical protein
MPERDVPVGKLPGRFIIGGIADAPVAGDGKNLLHGRFGVVPKFNLVR